MAKTCRWGSGPGSMAAGRGRRLRRRRSPREPAHFMRGQVVHDHDIAFAGRGRALLDVGVEGGPIHGTIEHHGSHDAVARSWPRGWWFSNAPKASYRLGARSAAPSHRGGPCWSWRSFHPETRSGSGPCSAATPASARARERRRVGLARPPSATFLCDKPSRLSVLQTVEICPASIPCSARADLISASVIPGLVAVSSPSSTSWPSSRGRL